MGRRHISATMLGITWTEKWLEDGSAEVDQSLGPLGRVYVKNIVYQVKINDLKHLKACITYDVATVALNMLQATWNEVEYCMDICRATKGAHIVIH
jgi:hypothetical protein